VEFTKEEASQVAGVVDDNGLFATNLREKPLADFLIGLFGLLEHEGK